MVNELEHAVNMSASIPMLNFFAIGTRPNALLQSLSSKCVGPDMTKQVMLAGTHSTCLATKTECGNRCQIHDSPAATRHFNHKDFSLKTDSEIGWFMFTHLQHYLEASPISNKPISHHIGGCISHDTPILVGYESPCLLGSIPFSNIH